MKMFNSRSPTIYGSLVETLGPYFQDYTRKIKSIAVYSIRDPIIRQSSLCRKMKGNGKRVETVYAGYYKKTHM